MSKASQKDLDFLSNLEQIDFFGKVCEKDCPPISPVPTETRELARRSLSDLRKKLEKAKERAEETQQAVEVDGSRLTGVKSGDGWRIFPDGKMERFYEPNEGLLEGLLQRRTERVADSERDVPFDLLLKVLSFSQWAPNATNEQPTKILVYKKDHPSMHKIGELMHEALFERIIPNINIRNYIVQKKREEPEFLSEFSLQDLVKMDQKTFDHYDFVEMEAPLTELPQTAEKLLERKKVLVENGKYYKMALNNQKGDLFKMKDLVANDITFAKGMGMFFLKFKNTHPYLVVVFRKWHYTSLMTETLSKYGIQLPDVGEEFIDAGFYTDHLALSARGHGLSGVVKTGPMDLAKNQLTQLFIDDLSEQLSFLKKILQKKEDIPEKQCELIQKELKKTTLLWKGLKYGLEAMRCKDENRLFRKQLLVALKRGEVYVPATFFQMGYPLQDLEERIRDPRQGKNPLDEMIVMMR